jgi:hypothetical protein
MSGYAGFPRSDVRAKLGQPVVDADAHVVEPLFAIEGYMRDLIRKPRSRTCTAQKSANALRLLREIGMLFID